MLEELDKNERAPIDKKEYDKLIKDAEEVLVSLSARLSIVTVKVGANSKDVLNAIRVVFGKHYIKSDGSSEITFDMFKQLTESLKSVGKDKVEEYL